MRILLETVARNVNFHQSFCCRINAKRKNGLVSFRTGEESLSLRGEAESIVQRPKREETMADNRSRGWHEETDREDQYHVILRDCFMQKPTNTKGQKLTCRWERKDSFSSSVNSL